MHKYADAIKNINYRIFKQFDIDSCLCFELFIQEIYSGLIVNDKNVRWISMVFSSLSLIECVKRVTLS